MIDKPQSIFDRDEFKGHAAAWADRQKNLAFRKAYYDGTIYKSIRDRFLALGKLHAVLGPRLYRGTKALFLMLARAVDVDAGIIPGGWSFAESAPATWETATKQVFAWSDWATDGVLYVHYGAQYGVTGLKVADLREAGRVVIKPLDPTTFMLVRTGQYDPTPRLAIIVETRQNADGERYEYAEVIEPTRIRTFIDGELMGVDGRESEYPNALGFVPVVEREHIRTGEALGECTAQKAFPILDELNELASYLADIIKKHAEAQWIVKGAEASDLEKSGDNIWFFPEGGDAQALVAAIDITGVLEFIREIRVQVEEALPELAFAVLKQKDQIATATLELQLAELVFKVKRCRPNYDHGLADALRMAGKAAKSMGISELAALDDEALSFDTERPILPLDRLTQIAIAQAELALAQQRAMGQAEAMQPAARPSDMDGAGDDEGDNGPAAD
jgi:hypothetical protein